MGDPIIDRISNLPQNVINDIMECLPLRTAAKMTALSQKWRDNWLNLPCLVLDATFFEQVLSVKPKDMLKYSSLVSKILLQHKGPILRFTLYIPRLKQEPDINPWISFLSMNGIKELTLLNHNKAPTRLPFTLFSCVDLTKLKLRYFLFYPPHYFKGFRCLLSLHLENIAFRTTSTFDELIASCPHLEKLTLRKWTGFHLTINAPNLKYLTISGTFSYIRLSDSPKLLSASITPNEPISCSYKGEAMDLFKYFASSCKIEKLKLGGCFLESFVAWNTSKVVPVELTYAKKLSLPSVNSSSELSFAVDIFRSCPNIQMLDISVAASDVDVTHKLISDQSCEFPNLQTIHATVSEASNIEFELLELLLGCSPKLKNFGIVVTEELDYTAIMKFYRKMNQFRKASPNIIIMIYMLGDNQEVWDFADDDSSEEEGTDEEDESEEDYESDYD